MRASFDKWWLLPPIILTASALLALGIVVFGRAASEPTKAAAGDCSGTLSSDYACQQERYRDLVLGSGVEAAFAELKDEHKENDFVRSNCHQLTHVIGQAGAERHGDVPGAYGRGDHFCGGGYYHGAMETIVAEIGADKILDEANTLCAELSQQQERSYYHRNCVHGLGHGFMGILENELFESLAACDALTDGWEKEQCNSGVFMQNIMAYDDSSRPSKYLKADRPLYPCTDVETRYKNTCYRTQTSYALRTQGNDFAKVFDLCGEVEGDYRPACYRSLGGDAFDQGMAQNVTDAAQAESTSERCMLGGDYEARSNCVAGAVRIFILYYNLYNDRSDTRVEALCESFDGDLRSVCLQAAEEYYQEFQP